MKTYGGIEVYPPFLDSALVGGECSASRPCRLTPREENPRYPLDKEAEWAPELVWTLWKTKILHCRESKLKFEYFSPQRNEILGLSKDGQN
jgi:hypothetical protein